MSVMNTFISGGESMKDLTSFVSHAGATIDYARYVITPYTGSKPSSGVAANATHVFLGMIHFVGYTSNISITIPESYIICGLKYIDIPKLELWDDVMSTVRFQISNNRRTLSYMSNDISGFIFPSFLCYK